METMIELVASLRGSDNFGSGHYGASRGDRTHKGIDYAAIAGNHVKSPVAGEVTKLGQVYGATDKFRYVQITDEKGYLHRFFYVFPSCKFRDEVVVGDIIGTVQDIAKYHENGTDKKMINHCHYEIKTAAGEYINPGLPL